MSALARRVRSGVMWLVQPSPSLRGQVARGVIWLSGGDAVAAILGFIKLAVFARLLSATDFGLFAIALMVSVWLEYLTELGFRDALIRQQDDIAPYIDAVWTAQLLRGGVIAVVIAASAPLVAWYYDAPLAATGMQLLATDIMVRALANPTTVYLRKNLDLMRDILWRLSGPLAGLLGGVVVALLLRNALALFCSVLAASIVQTIASYWIRPYRPRLSLDYGRARDLIGFGHRCFWLRVVSLLNWNLDTLVVGKVLGLTVTGHYQMAFRLSSVPGSVIGAPIHGVMFPAFSNLAGPQHQREALVRTLAIVLCITLPMALGLALFSPLIVRVLLGPGWGGVPALLSVLACFAVTLPAGHVLNALFMALDRVELDIRAAAFRATVLVLLIYPAVMSLGSLGAAWIAATAAVAGLVCQGFLAARLLSLRPVTLLACARGGALACLPLILAWATIGTAPSPSGIVVSLAFGAVSGAIGLTAAWRVFSPPIVAAIGGPK